MKKVLLSLVFVSGLVFAQQTPKDEQHDPENYRKEWRKKAKKWHQHSMERMKKMLNLTEKQQEQLKALKQQQWEALKEEREEMRELRKRMWEKRKELRKQREQQLKEILTPEQFTQWQTMKKERHSHHKKMHEAK